MAGSTENKSKGIFFVRWFRVLYQWVMHWADTRYATPMLGVLSFTESSFFPIPPDVLLIPMAISRPDRAFRFGAITWITSVLGGMAGYMIGMLFFDTLGIRIIEFYGVMDKYFLFREWFEEYNFAIIMVAGLTPLPYKVFTITAGVAKVNFPVFVLGSVMSRGVRFMAEAVVCRYGDDFTRRFFKLSIREFLDRYIEWFMVAMAVLGVAGFIVVKVALPGGGVSVEKTVTMASGTAARVSLISESLTEDKHRLSYELSLAADGSSISASLPGRPFLEPSRGSADVLYLPLAENTLIAPLIYSDMPSPAHGTRGEVFFFLADQEGLVLLERLQFTRYKLVQSGAWLEGSISIEASERQGEVIARISTSHHPAGRTGMRYLEEEVYRYRLSGDELVLVEHEKPHKLSLPKEGGKE